METTKKCLQCKKDKPCTEYWTYKKSGKDYNWCKDCVKESAHLSFQNHLAKSKACRQRWGIGA